MHPSPTLIPIFALMIPMVVVPTSLWFKHRRRVLELEHAERIRALEMGVRPGGAIGWPGALMVVGLGAGVPVGTMLVAWLATLTADAPNEVFGIPFVLSFAAIWSAKELAERMMGTADEERAAAARRTQAAVDPRAKPVVDPDAYDFVGSRG